MLGGESLFQNTFTATQPGQELWLAPSAEGDVVALEMNNTYEVMLHSGAYLAASPSVTPRHEVGRREGLLRCRPLLA
ncbi:MAG: AIM24 family protein [Polyangiales bacterium]